MATKKDYLHGERLASAAAVMLLLTLTSARSADILELPNGGWISAPITVDAESRPPSTSGWSEPFFSYLVAEDKSLSRVLFDALPSALQAKVKTPPPIPRSSHSSGDVDQALVFPCGHLTSDDLRKYLFAFADSTGAIGSVDTLEFAIIDNVCLITPACLPRLSRDVTLHAWHKPESYSGEFDTGVPPVASLTFRNPLYGRERLWEDGKQVTELDWRGRTLRLMQATSQKGNFDVRLEFLGLQTKEDFDWDASHTCIEDSRGNRTRCFRFFSTTGQRGFTFPAPLFWPENPNLRFTIFAVPNTLLAIHAHEKHTLEIDLPENWDRLELSDKRFEINGVRYDALELSKTNWNTKNEETRHFDRWFEQVELSYHCGPVPENIAPRIHAIEDGIVPHHERFEEISKPVKLLGNPGKTQLGIWISKGAKRLSIIFVAPTVEPLEFYFQSGYERPK